MDVDGYLRRLGLASLAGQAPSVAGLHALHTAHAERVPYECLEIWLGRPTTIEPRDSVRRIVAGRGGYCYHLNGAFSALLRALGYQVTRHVGGVQGNASQPAEVNANHLVLTVSGLPSDDAPGGTWLVDLGMGDGLHAPLPLVAGEYRQGPFRYALRPSEVEPGGWRFDHDPAGSFLGMDFRGTATEMTAFQAQHQHLSTSPESGFVRVATAVRRDATGVDLVRTLVLTRIGADPRRVELTTRNDYFTAMADVFGLTFTDVTAAERDALWSRLAAAHEQWLAGQPA
ncbi:arylamine N-acetyltransferase [Actinoplanes cyaneus]|uniref:Arylamine N-acetyltransferase n=1 Tax=Actinoplanes cyaneus TaxID=52696 RepID=A0A919IG32_9ACTN|nr:arylamine N-acetyltransferase [Actinoplanes cyaneus]MCW2138054.1 Arylamine N-acetyltransferase [Actinoplanes cyaneus]GID64737.1 arylamine N-acetyltransferase [Actinoplanes cyaneus]